MKVEGKEITLFQQEPRKRVLFSHWLDNCIGLFPKEKPKIQKNISYLLVFKIIGEKKYVGGNEGSFICLAIVAW